MSAPAAATSGGPPIDPGIGPPSAPPPPVLDNAARQIPKATLVPLLVDASEVGGAMVKYGYVGQLGLRPEEVDVVRAAGPPVEGALLDTLASFAGSAVPGLRPAPSAFVDVPADALQAFGRALIEVRQRRVDELAGGQREAGAAVGAVELGEARLALHHAVLAAKGLAFNTGATPIGMLNLERIEMVPAGVERGELVATIPLAPLEETAVTHKEWSVTSREFTSIVTDSLESVSETGVTDNTELAQSTGSQLQHSNQFNITGTVSGGIPLISGSTTAGFTAQDSGSQSATESTKHATAVTRKASSRAKQEHKVTISTTTVTGTSETATRVLKNPSSDDPVRIDYFSLMRKWRVRLYRYGLRLTYDVVVPEPAAAMRKAYATLEYLRSQLGPFVFNVPHTDVTPEIRPGDPLPPRPHYLVLADRYNAQVGPPPEPRVPVTVSIASVPGIGIGNHNFALAFEVPAGYRVTSITLDARVTSPPGVHFGFRVLGTKYEKPEPQGDQTYPPERLVTPQGKPFLEHATGSQSVLLLLHDAESAAVGLTVAIEPSPEGFTRWQLDAWNTLFNAAQTQYFAEQQEIATQVAELENELNTVDTLTLRREESDEIMKSVLRSLLGTTFDFMPADVLAAFKAANVDLTHGIGFTGGSLGISPEQWSIVRLHEDVVRFINQAIEWENVVTFLYSYFWDVPESWDFIRRIRNPDATRQAFLRAGSARVVLTVRKGWEDAWVRFAEGGFHGAEIPDDHPYLTVAQEIAGYDDRNYPGIPPANPTRTAIRLPEAVYTTSNVAVAPNPANPRGPVSIKVASSAGFAVGAPVVIDVAELIDGRQIQEAQLVTAIPDATHLVVERLDGPHNGTTTPFPVLQPGEKGALIAEWNEYTPTSGTDIAVTSNLATIA